MSEDLGRPVRNGGNDDKAETATPASTTLSTTIVKHYNHMPEKGLSDRAKSRIFYMRNFNNWIKAVVISDILQRIKRSKDTTVDLSVLDLCCGKGGDLLKWKQGRIGHLVCADIAGEAVEQCKQRYNDMLTRGRAERFPSKAFTAQFITADCSKQRLKALYQPNVKFDLCSCQFSYHYSFESYEQADMMLRNACECLLPGGYFVASTTSSYELVKRLKNGNSLSFGNALYNITFSSHDNFPVFGCKYDFTLDEVVNCPEFLVYFPVLAEMAEKYGMELVFCKTFADIFEEHKDDKALLFRINALEEYPPDDFEPSSSNPLDFDHVKAVYDEKRQYAAPQSLKFGTLSLAQWQVSSLYIMFAFRKSM